MYNYNLAVTQQNAWYNVVKPTYNQAAYIGVNRTNSESHAITGIILLEASERPDAKDRTELMTEMVKSGFNHVANESLNRGEVTSTFTAGNLYIDE